MRWKFGSKLESRPRGQGHVGDTVERIQPREAWYFPGFIIAAPNITYPALL
jgi:hypothetical protein